MFDEIDEVIEETFETVSGDASEGSDATTIYNITTLSEPTDYSDILSSIDQGVQGLNIVLVSIFIFLVFKYILGIFRK